MPTLASLAKSTGARICTAADVGLQHGVVSHVRLDGCTQLDLSTAALGSEGARSLAAALKSPAFNAITHVNLTWTALGSESEHLISALAAAPRLHTLDLSSNWLGDTCAGCIRRLLRRARRLRRLHLRWNSLTDEGAKTIAEALRTSPKLVDLDLSGNWLRGLGTIKLCRGLRGHPGLKRLGLNFNAIDQNGVEWLADALAVNGSVLATLELGGNEINDKGTHALARLLTRGHPLKVLSLHMNERVTDVGALHVARALRANAHLTQLDLSGNRISSVGAASIGDALDENAALLDLNLADNAPERRQSKAYSDLNASTIRVIEAKLAGRAGWRRMRPLVKARARHVGPTPASKTPSRAAVSAGSRNADLSFTKYQRGTWGTSFLANLGAVVGIRSSERIHSSAQPAASGAHGGAERRLGAMRGARARHAGPASRANILQQGGLEPAAPYWQRVYPLASSQTICALASGNRSRMILVFKTAPASIIRQSCVQQPWRVCRLDAYFGRSQEPPKIPYGALFAPFRMPPGTCMRSLFGWGEAQQSRKMWETAYPFAGGAADGTWIEVAHTRDQSGGAWMYLAKGSGIFWNVGTSLRARNKVAAAIRLTEQFTPFLSREVVQKTPVETLARAIELNDPRACDHDHCSDFVKMMHSQRGDRNDNCYGECSLGQSSLASWLRRVADGAEPAQWKVDHMSASSVFDQIIWRWAKKVGYDSVQLMMQPQVWCGLTWTSELLDLRVRRHRPHDMIPHLSLRDPHVPADANGSAPCVVRTDNSSRRAFHLCVYCEGSLMERSARCLADVSAGKALSRFTT